MARNNFFSRIGNTLNEYREMERTEKKSKEVRNKGLLLGVLLGAILYMYTDNYAVVLISMFLGMMLGIGMDRRSKQKDKE